MAEMDIQIQSKTVAADIDEFFGDGGILSRSLPDYEPRKPQVEVAKMVGKAFDVEKHLIVEAGTGTGKSLAYLVPAIHKTIQEGNRAVIVTANIALQEQLVEKDLPFIQDVLPVDFEFALMKGRNNYLCMESLASASQGKLEFSNGSSLESVILKWSKQTDTGDKSELEFIPPDDIWRLFSSSSEECLGDKCEYKDICFVNKAREGLKACNVIVANYHLLLAHVKLRLETTQNLVLPEFDYLVCDEGHRVADIARNFFGWTVSEYAVTRLINALKKGADSLSEKHLAPKEKADIYQLVMEAERGRDGMWEGLSRFYPTEERNPKTLRKREMVKSKGLEEIVETMGAEFKMLSGREPSTKPAARLSQNSDRCLELAAQLREVRGLEDSNAVYYVDRFGNSKALRLHKRALDVSEDLWEGLYSTTKSTIVTSATLAVGGSCGYVRKEIGFRKAREMVVGSPFDYKKQGMLILSPRAPDPTKEDFTDRICQVLEYVVSEAEGRTLGLFTSYKNLRAARDYLVPRLTGYKILCQGDAPRMQLVADFKEDVSSVLLGTESFWAGVDVPGEACSCVVIDRIPFKSPGDPIWDALTRRSENWFFDLGVPAAAIQLKQGVGRLIRRSTDRGVVIILDRRMVTKPYGRTLAKSLPGMTLSNTLKGSIKGWLNRE